MRVIDMSPEMVVRKREIRRQSYYRNREATLARMRAAYPGRKARVAEYAKDYYQRNAESIKRRVRKYWLKTQLKVYGLTVDQYNAMVTAQEGLCAICRGTTTDSRKKRLEVDHDHATGLARGLLCNACNCAIGLLRNDAVLFEAGAAYLRRPK